MNTQLTNQQAFDAALFGIRKQGYTRSVDDRTLVCMYRHPKDSSIRCAAGHIIPDDVYDPLVENSTIRQILGDNLCEELDTHAPPRNLPITGWLRRQVKGGLNIRLLSELQHAHDETLDASDTENRFSRGIDAFEAEMARIAREYNLHYTEGSAT